MLIKEGLKIEEGKVICKWFEGRVIRKNKNVIAAVTGATGSGKSYTCLRIAELWYASHFKGEFPIDDNTCFSIGKTIRRLKYLLDSNTLRKGEIIIIEEAGVINNALDFQNKISKLFNFVLQSFRKFNIILLFNLPVLSMMNKNSRLLLHAHLIMQSIDEEKKIAKCKMYIHQLNQQSGKSYWKFLRIKRNGLVLPVKRFAFSIPNQKDREIYEKSKSEFLMNLTDDFIKELEEIDIENLRKESRKELTDIEFEVLKMLQEGKEVKEIARIRQRGVVSIYEAIARIKNKGFMVEKGKNLLEKSVFKVSISTPKGA